MFQVVLIHRGLSIGNIKIFDRSDIKYSPETSVPRAEGTVMKCDFCPDMAREGKLPHCVTGCPMGVIYYGDKNEDIVTNGEESLQFSKVIKEKEDTVILNTWVLSQMFITYLL